MIITTEKANYCTKYHKRIVFIYIFKIAKKG